MKATCDRERLLSSFQAAAAVAPSRSPHPILKNVKIEVGQQEAVLLATDLEVGIRIDVEGLEVDAPGSALLPIDRVSAILRESSDDTVELETDTQGIWLRTANSQFNLPSENPDEFPTVGTFTEQKYHEVPARFLREVIRRTAFATDVESTRYALGGVLLELDGQHLIAVGTDGRRLAKMEGVASSVGGHATGENTTIVPTRAMHAIERLLHDGDAEVQIAARGNDILVRTRRFTVLSRLVEGRFPRWRDVLPDLRDSQTIELVVGPLHAAIRQAAITASTESRGVDFAFGEGRVVLTGRSAERGQSRVVLPAPYDGPAIAIMLDPRFFIDFLRVLEPEGTFRLHLHDGESPAVCQTEDGYSYVIMPLARDQNG